MKLTNMNSKTTHPSRYAADYSKSALRLPARHRVLKEQKEHKEQSASRELPSSVAASR
jgi:hypothetical protein